jgi:steroid delta-isomerase-like uncharacterized protein
MSTQASIATMHRNAREDSAFRFLGLPTLMRSTAESTGGAFGLMEHWSIQPGFASPYHTHSREDEAFYVLEGEMAFICDGVWHRGGPGTYVFGPRGLAHGFKAVGNSPARMLLLCSPGGFESFVVELGAPLEDPIAPPDMSRLIATAERYGVEIHGPLPEEPAESANQAVLSYSGNDLKVLNARWIQAFNDRDWKTEREVRGDSFQARLSGTPVPLDNDAWSSFMTEFTSAFPDSHIAIESMVAEGDTVVSRWNLSGTHGGAFNGVPATGNSIQFKGIEWNRVSGGKLVEHIAQFDLAALLQQIGAMPS